MHGTMTGIKNRKGRKRKSGRRTSTGRLIAERVDFKGFIAAQPHRNWLPAALQQHERAGDVLGCLNLKKLISDNGYEAGRRFSVIVGAFRQVIGAPRGTAGGGRGYGCNPSDCQNLGELCICEQRTANYWNACAYLQSAGQKAYNVTYQVVISEMIPEPSQMAELTQGLAALERGFGLGGRK
jgi:hypothetical protein